MISKSIVLYVRLAVVLLAACCWNQLVGQLTPYYVTTSICTPGPPNNNVCTAQWGPFWAGTLQATINGLCYEYAGTSHSPLYAGVQDNWNCNNNYTGVVSSYPTPQPNDPYHYAVTAGGYFSGCSPGVYWQTACDSQWNYQVEGCELSPC
jgi:hypothetical protein